MKSEKTKAKDIVVVNPNQSVNQLFCDGVSNLAIGASNCKLDLFQIISGNHNEAEHRNIVQVLVMPTAALVELCRSVLDSIEGSSEVLRSVFSEQEAKIFGAVQGPGGEVKRS